MERQLPHNLEAERSLLGGLLIRNEALFDVTPIVTKGDFFEPYHSELFTLIRDQVEAGRQASPSALMHDVSQDADIGGIRATEYLGMLAREAPPAIVIPDLARALRDLSMKRRLISVAYRLVEEAHNAPVTLTADEMIARYEGIFGTLFSSVSDVGMRHIQEIGRAVEDRVAEAIKTETTAGLRIGLKGVEDLIGALLPGRLYILAGDSGSGKSKLAQQIGMFVGETVPVLMQQIEMDAEEVATREIASRSDIAENLIDQGAINAEDWEKIHEAVEGLKHSQFYVDSSSGPTAAMIRGRAIRMKKMTGLGLLIVDHALYIASPDPRLQEHQAVRANLQAMKRLAKDLRIPVIVLMPLKKEYGDQPQIKRPTKNDVYGGSAPFQEADVMFFTHRAEAALRQREPDEKDQKARGEWEAQIGRAAGKAEIVLAKRRGGKGWGVRTMGFSGVRGFTDRQPSMIEAAAEADLLPL